jgi:uncharacterized protein
MRMRTLVSGVAAVALAVSVAAAPAIAAEPRVLAWEELMPPAPAGAPPKLSLKQVTGTLKLSDALENIPDENSGAPPITSAAAEAEPPAPLVESLNGQSVRLDGYLLPLDFESLKVSEFLLVPYVGACVHVPPPPANQVVYIKLKDGYDVTDAFAPVSITGTLRTGRTLTAFAEAGYSIEDGTITVRTE